MDLFLNFHGKFHETTNPTHCSTCTDPALLIALAENLMEIVGAMHPDAASGLGTLGTTPGTFSGTNSGDQEGQGALHKALEAIAALARDMIAGATPGTFCCCLRVGKKVGTSVPI